MDLLLDTHIFIWFLNGDKQLNSSLRDIIENTSNKYYLSIASIWEIAIKRSLNKLDLKGSFDEIAIFLSDNYIETLPITFQHIQQLLQLDFHHRDPFDRIIIAQALSENLTLATNDTAFREYKVPVFWK